MDNNYPYRYDEYNTTGGFIHDLDCPPGHIPGRDPVRMTGWICPRCGHVWSPFVTQCTCWGFTYNTGWIGHE